jgi:hypothetical protein
MNVSDARCEALFASRLQRSDAPSGKAVAEAIRVTVRELGTRGCAGLMAQEFGDHPEAAAERMRWVRQLLGFPAMLRGAVVPAIDTQGLASYHRGGNSPMTEWQELASALPSRRAC